MAMITLTDKSWSSVTLTQNEIWQCREGRVLLSNEAETSADSDQGIELIRGSVRFFKSGTEVRYRNATQASARICREADA